MTRKSEKKQDRTIRVRDRRARSQFSIHNRIIDEWFPIIGAQGYALYGLYCRMAGNEDERCWPGYRLIAKHMRVGQSTISDYNKLLVWCGLIHIEEGDPLTNTPNEYYILDIPQVTSEALAAVKTAVTTNIERLTQERKEKARKLAQAGLLKEAEKLRRQKPNKFLQTCIKQLENWKPIQVYWTGHGMTKPEVVKPGQMSLFDPAPDAEHPAPDTEHPAPDTEHPAPDAEYPAPDAEYPAPDAEYPAPDTEHPAPGSGAEQSETTIRNNNPKQQSETTTAATVAGTNGINAAVAAASSSTSITAINSTLLIASILNWMGFTGRLTAKDKNPAPAMLLAWAFWVKLNEPALKEQGKNAVGIARAGWRRGDMPGGDLVGLVQLWLNLDDSGRRVLIEAGEQARFYGRFVVNRELEELGVTNAVAKTFYALWLATDGNVAPDSLMPRGDDG